MHPAIGTPNVSFGVLFLWGGRWKDLEAGYVESDSIIGALLIALKHPTWVGRVKPGVYRQPEAKPAAKPASAGSALLAECLVSESSVSELFPIFIFVSSFSHPPVLHRSSKVRRHHWSFNRRSILQPHHLVHPARLFVMHVSVSRDWVKPPLLIFFSLWISLNKSCWHLLTLKASAHLPATETLIRVINASLACLRLFFLPVVEGTSEKFRVFW